jgi:hypothetical protein
MSPNSDTSSRFRATQSLLSLLNATCLAQLSNTYQFYCLWFDPIGDRTHDLSHSGEHANDYTTDALHYILKLYKNVMYILCKTFITIHLLEILIFYMKLSKWFSLLLRTNLIQYVRRNEFVISFFFNFY